MLALHDTTQTPTTPPSVPQSPVTDLPSARRGTPREEGGKTSARLWKELIGGETLDLESITQSLIKPKKDRSSKTKSSNLREPSDPQYTVSQDSSCPQTPTTHGTTTVDIIGAPQHQTSKPPPSAPPPPPPGIFASPRLCFLSQSGALSSSSSPAQQRSASPVCTSSRVNMPSNMCPLPLPEERPDKVVVLQKWVGALEELQMQRIREGHLDVPLRRGYHSLFNQAIRALGHGPTARDLIKHPKHIAMEYSPEPHGRLDGEVYQLHGDMALNETSDEEAKEVLATLKQKSEAIMNNADQAMQEHLEAMEHYLREGLLASSTAEIRGHCVKNATADRPLHRQRHPSGGEVQSTSPCITAGNAFISESPFPIDDSPNGAEDDGLMEMEVLYELEKSRSLARQIADGMPVSGIAASEALLQALVEEYSVKLQQRMEDQREFRDLYDNLLLTVKAVTGRHRSSWTLPWCSRNLEQEEALRIQEEMNARAAAWIIGLQSQREVLKHGIEVQLKVNQRMAQQLAVLLTQRNEFQGRYCRALEVTKRVHAKNDWLQTQLRACIVP